MSEPQFGLSILPMGKEADVVIVKLDELGHSYVADMSKAAWIRVEENDEPVEGCRVRLSEHGVKLAAAGLIEALTYTDLGAV